MGTENPQFGHICHWRSKKFRSETKIERSVQQRFDQGCSFNWSMDHHWYVLISSGDQYDRIDSYASECQPEVP